MGHTVSPSVWQQPTWYGKPSVACNVMLRCFALHSVGPVHQWALALARSPSQNERFETAAVSKWASGLL
eukprot:4569890-Alexandrium_andersonii.AAC.1